MAAKNHQLEGSASARVCIAPTPLAYHSRSGLSNGPFLFQAFARVNFAIRRSHLSLQSALPNRDPVADHSGRRHAAGAIRMWNRSDDGADDGGNLIDAVRPRFDHVPLVIVNPLVSAQLAAALKAYGERIAVID